eukprot:4696621-Alexandrium_andersonii.AAC.1
MAAVRDHRRFQLCGFLVVYLLMLGVFRGCWVLGDRGELAASPTLSARGRRGGSAAGLFRSFGVW